MTYYELLGIDPSIEDEKIAEAAEQAFTEKASELYQLKNDQKITYEEFRNRYAELKEAKRVLTDDALRQEYDNTVFEDDLEDEEKRDLSKTIKRTAVAAVVVGVIGLTLFLNKDNIASLFSKTGADSSDLGNKVTVEETYDREDESQIAVTDPTEETKETEAQEATVIDYGDIQDEALVRERVKVLISELNAAGVVNPTTVAPFTEDEIVALVQYASGVYTPSTMEEIDILHLNLLNLLISPLNTDPYLYHVVFASGNDSFNDIVMENAKNMKSIDFASAFAEYGENGVYPLTVWMQQKREQIYSSTDRDEINKIFVEVGQVMADIMKGNGCTITVYEDKQEKTYTFTSEQILANHASAMLLTIDAQLIFANKYEIRDENDKVVDSVQTQWEVYNKFNSTEEPDIVSLEEIEAWINNGCDYEWAIDSVLINGQTFGQRIQGDMEGMAQNNYAMNSENKTLSK